eukprot:Nk52_evm92s207 gene=Nk52_evmTU92s207
MLYGPFRERGGWRRDSGTLSGRCEAMQKRKRIVLLLQLGVLFFLVISDKRAYGLESDVGVRMGEKAETEGKNNKERAKKGFPTLDGTRPLIFGHRGDPYFAPPETFASYSISMREGADYVEPDVMQTRDGVLVCHHDLALSDTTNVELLPQFAEKKRYKVIDGSKGNVSDWYVDDFDLSELKELDALQRKSAKDRDMSTFDGKFKILTFDEMIDFVHNQSIILNRSIGIVPEFKHGQYFRRLNLQMNRSEHFFEDSLLRILKEKGYNESGFKCSKSICSHVILQSFENDILKYVRKESQWKTLMLVGPSATEYLPHENREVFMDWYLTKGAPKKVAEYADYLGLAKELILLGRQKYFNDNTTSPLGYKFSDEKYRKDVSALGGYLNKDEIVASYHAQGVRIVPYTFRNPKEDPTVGLLFDGKLKKEYHALIKKGVDGLFVEKEGPAICSIEVFNCSGSSDIISGGSSQRKCTGMDKKSAWGGFLFFVSVMANILMGTLIGLHVFGVKELKTRMESAKDHKFVEEFSFDNIGTRSQSRMSTESLTHLKRRDSEGPFL